MKTGRYNIAQLLTSPEVEQIVIPELQRDYVWGERNVKGLLASILANYKSIVNQTLLIKDSQGNGIDSDIMNYLNEEYMRLRYNTRVGFIYAYHDRTLSDQYYLIDGQQRITTIFLILLALYSRSKYPEQFRKLYFVSSLPKLDYKVRDVAHNFLVDFIEYELTKKNNNDTFKESSKYYHDYDKDATALSIYANYYNVIVPELAHYEAESLINYIEHYIEFNYFDTNMSEQGEKLYLYMNSRGESLSAQERIKSIIVGRSSDKLKAGKMWEDWQNFFWRVKSQSDKNADRGFFEFLKWATIIHLCSFSDTKIKQTISAGKTKNRIEEIEDYIRIEKDPSARIRQADWICAYITENEKFTYEWLLQVESAVEWLYKLLQLQIFQKWDFDVNPWFTGCEETIEYSTLLGLISYIVSFHNNGIAEINVLRMAMYLKNLKSEYTLRRNPDRAVIRSINLIRWMAKNKITDVRLLGKCTACAEENLNDNYVLRNDDLRWGYYQLDWQNAQGINSQADELGRWESFFWKITNNKGLNNFLRGNHDFVVKVIQKVSLCPDKLLTLFVDKIYNNRISDKLRKDLLAYGDISIYDKGGSNNIGPNWMERWCLLASNRDESYWDEFMNGKNSDKNAEIVASYLSGNQIKRIDDHILKELGNNLEYMKQKYYLWDEHKQLRIVLLQDKQASKAKARELCVQCLHKSIPNSWVWEHNFCVINFIPTEQGLNTNISNKNTGYYIDLWYDWAVNGGKWYCRIGHKEFDLSDNLIRSIESKANKELLNIECNWIQEISNNHISLRTKNPIYIETPKDDYFHGSRFVKSFFDNMWALLIKLNNDDILI